MTGNMLIAQSGGPSMVINQSLVGAVLAAKASTKIVEIYGALHGIQGILDEAFIDLRAEPEEVLLRVAQTPSSALGSVRRKPTPDDCKAIPHPQDHRQRPALQRPHPGLRLRGAVCRLCRARR